MTRHITEITEQLYNEGYVEGTPAYDYVFLKRKVEKCQELRSVSDCRVCLHFDDCEMVKSYMRQTRAFQQQATAEAAKRRKEAQERATASVGHVLPILALEEKKDD